MKNPLVSILITSFNKGKYLDQCIKSCVSQTYKNYEIIVLDNYSTDNSVKILHSYKNKIKILKKKRISRFPMTNQLDLLIKGFKASKGSIICLMDADDFYNSKKIEIVKNAFLKRKKIDVLFDLPIIHYKNKKNKFKFKNKIQKNIWQSIVPTSSISVRRSFFKKIVNPKFVKDFNLLAIDFRINVLSINILKNYYVLKPNLTFYTKVDDGIMSNIKKYSKLWWKMRKQAHTYMAILLKKNKITYKNLDNSITNIINFFL